MGEKGMGGEDRLGSLQVRVAWHQCGFFSACSGDKGGLESADLAIDVVDRLARPQPQRGGNLIVATAGGMQFATDIAKAVNQRCFDVHVNIFEIRTQLDLALLKVRADIVQGGDKLFRFIHADQSNFTEHLGMRHGASDILPPQAHIDGNGCGEGLDERMCCAGKAAAPSFFFHAVNPRSERSWSLTT